MKGLKYLGVALCILLIVERIPSVYLITKGLIIGQVDDPTYFAVKLCIYIAIIIVLAIVMVKLFKSARR